MSISFDALTSIKNTGAGAFSFDSPNSSPELAILFVTHSGSFDDVNSATWGGVSMDEAADSPLIYDGPGGDNAHVTCFFLGASVPTGVQTISVQAGTMASDKQGWALACDAAADCEENNGDQISGNNLGANPTGTIALGGVESFVCQGWVTGEGNINNVSPLSGWTSQDEYDAGGEDSGVYTYDTVGTSDVTYGLDTVDDNEEYGIYAIAFNEQAAGGDMTATGSLGITGAAQLRGRGEMSAAGALSLTGLAQLRALGALMTSGSLSLTGLAQLRAQGDMQAAGLGEITGAASLRGHGEMTAAGTLPITGAADLTGESASDMTAAGALAIAGAAALRAQGEMSGSAPISLTGLAAMRALGEMSATGAASISGAAVLRADGNMTAAGAMTIGGAADLTALGEMSAAGLLEILGAAGLTDANAILYATKLVYQLIEDRRIVAMMDDGRRSIDDAPSRLPIKGGRVH